MTMRGFGCWVIDVVPSIDPEEKLGEVLCAPWRYEDKYYAKGILSWDVGEAEKMTSVVVRLLAPNSLANCITVKAEEG
jgi:hypothetical protein